MEEFKQLTDREHILLRPEMYLGEMSSMTRKLFVNGQEKEVTYIPALLKIVNELIDNSIDEHIRSGKEYANKIKIKMDSFSFSIEDNGRGIPVVTNGEFWRPQVAWCSARSGTSFSENRVGAGAHGLGSFATNVFSKKFIGISQDGKKKCEVICEYNIESIETNLSKTKKNGVSVYIEPDFKRFSTEKFTETDIELIKSRISTLSVTYPSISFEFNDEKLQFKTKKDFFNLFGEVYKKVQTRDNLLIGVFPSDDNASEYQQYSSIDGLEFVQGGNHEIYIARELTNALREIIKKKNKFDMTLPEIKRGLKLIIVGSEFPNMKFSSQTKERLTNTESEIKQWIGMDIDWIKLAKEVYDTPEIINPIIEFKLAKQIAAEKRAITLAQKKMKKVYVEKHLPAKSKNTSETICFFTEGNCISENTEIKCVDSESNIINKKIKDVSKGDYVFTHNHKIRKVTNKTKKISDALKIKFGSEEIVCSPLHRFLVYNTETDSFEFLEASKIRKEIHKLVKSNFFEGSSGFAKLTKIEKKEDGIYEFEFDHINQKIQCKEDQKFVVFNQENQEISFVEVKDIKENDYLSFSAE